MDVKDKKFNNFVQFSYHFSDNEKCREHLEQLRWHGQPTCPHCGHEKAYKFSNGKTYKCAKCRKKFNALTGTIFVNTKIDLNKWFWGIYIATSHKKGISSVQLSKDIGTTQKTAWFMLHRIREMLKENAPSLLSGQVEVDETYIGGKEKNKHQSKKTKGTQGRSTLTKQPVIGIIQRRGHIVARSIKNTPSATLQPIMREHVQIGSSVFTDEWPAYRGLSKFYLHGVVNHKDREYVNGNISTNTVESFWALLKRGIIGIYHHVIPKHLDRYCNAFAFRYNYRNLGETDRFNLAVSRISGTRLRYSELIR